MGPLVNNEATYLCVATSGPKVQSCVLVTILEEEQFLSEGSINRIVNSLQFFGVSVRRRIQKGNVLVRRVIEITLFANPLLILFLVAHISSE